METKKNADRVCLHEWYDDATFDDLLDRQQFYEENIKRLQAELDVYRDAVHQLEPIMKGRDITFLQAIHEMQGEK